jgi:2',3'-cyclic-nucleotide 2'-phosphodiesterase (5'-nucleotidase family)
LGINIVDPSGNRPSWAQPSKIVERGGYKIGVIGAIGSVQSSIAVSSLSGYSFLDNYADLISAEASRLRNDEGCSLVVVSIHNGSFDTTNCHNIDAVFEGHTHLDYLKVDSYGIPHIQTSAYGSNFRHVRFDLSNGKFVYKNCDSIDYAFLSALNEEPMTLGVFGYYDGKNSAVKNEVVGHTTSELSRYQIARYAVQCLFEYYCNSSWDSALALAVVNTGCSRQAIPAGDITYGEVYASLPFDNDNVFCSCKGSDVTALMNDSYLYSYGTQTSFDVETTYHVMVISYVSEKTSYSFLSEISRDDYRLRDIVADDLRRNKNA